MIYQRVSQNQATNRWSCILLPFQSPKMRKGCKNTAKKASNPLSHEKTSPIQVLKKQLSVALSFKQRGGAY